MYVCMMYVLMYSRVWVMEVFLSSYVYIRMYVYVHARVARSTRCYIYELRNVLL